jgi:hypothetical protein
VRTGQVTGGAHERVIVEDVKDAGDRLNDVVLTQFGVSAVSRPFAAAPAIASSAVRVADPPSREALRRSRRGPSVAESFCSPWAAGALAVVVSDLSLPSGGAPAADTPLACPLLS